MDTTPSGADARAALGTIERSRHRTDQLTVRADVVGRRAALGMFVALVVLALVTVVVAVFAAVEGVSHPVTLASIVVAVLILLGGPRLMAAVRRRASRGLDES